MQFVDLGSFFLSQEQWFLWMLIVYYQECAPLLQCCRMLSFFIWCLGYGGRILVKAGRFVCLPFTFICVGVQVLHYVEKPESFVSSLINGGAYLFTSDLFGLLSEVFQANCDNPVRYVTINTILKVNPARMSLVPSILQNLRPFWSPFHSTATLSAKQSSIFPWVRMPVRN